MTAKVPSAHAKCRRLNLAELTDDLGQARKDAALGHWKAENLVGLAENDRQRHTIEKADENRPRQEVCKRTQSQEACGRTKQSGEQGEHH